MNQDLLHAPENTDSGLSFGVNFIARHLYIVSIGTAIYFMLFLKPSGLENFCYPAIQI
jgi:hypothetical protein